MRHDRSISSIEHVPDQPLTQNRVRSTVDGHPSSVYAPLLTSVEGPEYSARSDPNTSARSATVRVYTALAGLAMLVPGISYEAANDIPGREAFLGLPHTSAACSPVAPETLKRTEALLATPGDPEIENILHRHNHRSVWEYTGKVGPVPIVSEQKGPYLYEPGSDALDSIVIAYDIARNAAEPLGLMPHDPTPHLEKLGVSAFDIHESSVPFTAYYDTAHAYLKEFGVEMHLDDEIGADVLETEQAKWNMYSAIDAFAGLPQEYIDLAGIKHVRLISLPPERAAELAYVIVADSKSGKDVNETIFINIRQDIQPSTWYHELMHLVDRNICGGQHAMNNDPGYAALNNGDIYAQGTTLALSEDVANKQKEELLLAFQYAVMRGDETEARHINQEINKLAAAVNLTDWGYGGGNDHSHGLISEDKAEVGKQFPFPIAYIDVLDPENPTINAKFTYLMARIYSYRPELARFFNAIGRKLEQRDHSYESRLREVAWLVCHDKGMSAAKDSNSLAITELCVPLRQLRDERSMNFPIGESATKRASDWSVSAWRWY